FAYDNLTHAVCQNTVANGFWLQSVRAENRIFLTASGFKNVRSTGIPAFIRKPRAAQVLWPFAAMSCDTLLEALLIERVPIRGTSCPRIGHLRLSRREASDA